MCVADLATRDAMSSALKRCGFFEVVGEARDADELGEQLHMEYPDVVILDTAVSGEAVEAFLLDASAGRPVPALVLQPRETGKRAKSSGRWSITRLGKDVLFKQDLLSRNHVWARLLALADQLTASRHTQTATKLDEMIKAERARARHSGHRPEVVALATWPLDLILLCGGRGSDEVLGSVLAKLATTRVPVLVVVDGEHPLDERRHLTPRIPVQSLDQTVSVRRASGFLLAPANGIVTVGTEDIHLEQSHDPLSAAASVTSAGALHSGLLTVLLSDDGTSTAMALGSVLNAGGLVATLEAAEAPGPEGPVAAMTWQVAKTALRIDELAWVIEHAVPRRV